MNHDLPEQKIWISYVEVHTDEDLLIFDESTPLGLAFHDDMVHVSVMRDGVGINHFIPVNRVQRMIVREIGFTLVPSGTSLIQPR